GRATAGARALLSAAATTRAADESWPRARRSPLRALDLAAGRLAADAAPDLQQPVDRGWLADQVGEVVSVEHREEARLRLGEHPLQPAGADDGAGVVRAVEALDEVQVRLGVADDLADAYL